MSAIDEILLLLKDGEWHDLKEITEKIALPKVKAEMVVSFLSEYDFIQLNENHKKIKLKPPTHDFFEKIQRIEKEDDLRH
jgi:DNA-binding IclR family transcriptional regulator